jgi:hypothetical protein
VLAAPPDFGKHGPLHPCDDRGDRLWRNEARTVDADANDPPLLKASLQLTCDAFDFRKLRHASPAGG